MTATQLEIQRLQNISNNLERSGQALFEAGLNHEAGIVLDLIARLMRHQRELSKEGGKNDQSTKGSGLQFSAASG